MEEKIDLEKVRDEKCIPVAKAILGEMVTDLVNKDKDSKPLALKALSVMLSEDLNIDTEVSYVPQLLLRTLSEMNTTFQTCDVIQPDDEGYALIANRILKIVNDANISMDKDVTPESITKEFEVVKEKLNDLFKQEGITKLELDYIKDMIFDAFTNFNNTLQNSIAMATEKAESKALGIETMSDLTLKKLDKFLKS